jgi:hypothetical protein
MAKARRQPNFTNPRFFSQTYGTLDDLVPVLAERTDLPAAAIRQAIHEYGSDELWQSLIGPMLDDIEIAIGLKPRS